MTALIAEQTVNTNIRERVKQLIKHNGITVVEFARRLGVSLSTANRWINEGKTPNGYSIFLICATFGVSADWLLGLNRR